MKTLALAIATTALTATVAAAAGVADFDQNGDNFASKAEVAAVNATLTSNDFRDLDINRDNRLSNAEITAPGASQILNRGTTSAAPVRSVAALGGGSFVSEAQLAAAYPGLSSVVFDQIDLNGDNRVSSVELYASDAQEVLGRYEGGNGILVSLSSVDVNGDRFATLGELQAAYPGLSANDITGVDLNDDNRISFTEFYAPEAISIFGKNK